MDEEGTNDVQVEPDELFVSPLRVLTQEMHEVYLELLGSGFPEGMVAQILAQMLSEAILYRDGYAIVEIDDDDDDEDEDDDLDGTNT